MSRMQHMENEITAANWVDKHIPEEYSEYNNYNLQKEHLKTLINIQYELQDIKDTNNANNWWLILIFIFLVIIVFK